MADRKPLYERLKKALTDTLDDCQVSAFCEDCDKFVKTEQKMGGILCSECRVILKPYHPWEVIKFDQD